MIQQACIGQDITFESFSDEWVLRLSRGGTHRWICGNEFDINSSAASAVAEDKVATYSALKAANIPAVPHYLARSVAGEPLRTDELTGEIPPDNPVVAKPLSGHSGIGVRLFPSLVEALQFIATHHEPAWAVSPHIDVTVEKRYILLDDKSLLAYEKLEPVVENGLKYFNLSYGARARTLNSNEIDDKEFKLALRAKDAAGLRLAAVDISFPASGEAQVLEINNSITFENYARQSEENKKRATDVCDAIVKAMMR